MIRQLVGVLVYVALFAALLFGGAGTLHWRAAWMLIAVLLVARALSTAALLRSRPALLAERARLPLQRGQPLADRLLLAASMSAFAALVAVTAWERWHARLLPPPPLWLRAAGLLAFAAGWGLVHSALRANAYAVTVVRYQAERGQQVVTGGPYAAVRHPMYAGVITVMAGLALWLGSVAGVAAALVPGALLAARIRLEERVLRAALPGYAAYAARVRWRLVPGVW